MLERKEGGEVRLRSGKVHIVPAELFRRKHHTIVHLIQREPRHRWARPG